MVDLAIIGAGPAGLTASIYASRYKINHHIFGLEPGGQGNLAPQIENYPGYLSIKGQELMQKFVEQVRSYGVEIKQEQVNAIIKIPGGFEVTTEKSKYQAKSLILAMGASVRHLNISGEDSFLGKGVSYCTTCDIPLFRNKTVAIVGGGDSAVTGAIHAAGFVEKVYLIHRRREFRAEPAWLAKLESEFKIEKILENQVKEIRGKDKVEEIILDKPYQGKTNLLVDGVFIEIGQIPSSILAREIGVKIDKEGYIEVAPTMQTSSSGVFAAGDIAAILGGAIFRQFITSAADGARAAAGVYQFLHTAGPIPSWGIRK